MLGLPEGIAGCVFDLDGVLTDTAAIHADAWKQMFDGYLRAYAERTGQPFVPFDKGSDYADYVDGMPRYDGVRSFLASRQIHMPDGSPSDPPDVETVCGLGNRKNDLVLSLIETRGVEPYDGSVRFVEAARDRGLRRAVASSSTNCRHVLAAAGIEDLFEVVIDGVVAEREHMQGKPAPDTFLAAARALELEPTRAAVFEDALAGVAAGQAGEFGYVVGVDRAHHGQALLDHGATVVVQDLAELLEPG